MEKTALENGTDGNRNPSGIEADRFDPRSAWLRKRRAVRIESVDLSDILGEPLVLRVRGLTRREAAIWEAKTLDKNGKIIPERLRNNQERLLVEAIVDEHGQKYLSDDDLDDLAGMPSAAIDKLYQAAKRLSAIRDGEDQDLAGN